jgi:hypothetical protein
MDIIFIIYRLVFNSTVRSESRGALSVVGGCVWLKLKELRAEETSQKQIYRKGLRIKLNEFRPV